MPIDQNLEERLTQNRHETLTNTTQYAQQTPPTIDFEKTRAVLVASTLANGDGKEFYTTAIDKLLEASDARNHIAWVRKGKPHADGTVDLIRDARAVTVTKVEQPEKYISQYMNLCRAAERVIDTDSTIDDAKKKAAKETIRASAKKVLEDLKDKKITTPEQVDVKKRTALLVATLEDAGVKKAAKTLSMAKDFQFEDEHRHITTLSIQKDSSGLDRVVSESSIMALGTIPEIQAMYDAIAAAKKAGKEVPKSVEANGESHSMDWYHKASPEVQTQINANIESIAAGNKVIMNQLIDVLPGAKNCYEKTTCVFSPTQPLEVTRQMTTMHSGAPSFHGKGNQKELTRLQVRQLNAFSTGGVDINTLNSKVRITEKIESNIEGYVKDAVKKEGKGSVSVQPFNVLRHFTPRDNTAFNQTLGEAAKVINAYKPKESDLTVEQKTSIKKLTSYLTKRPSFLGRVAEKFKKAVGVPTKADKAREGLDIIKRDNPELGKSLEHAYNAATLMDSISLLDRNNKSSKLSAEMVQVTSDLTSDKGPLKTAAQKFGIEVHARKTLTHCKSGIDRTGTVMTHATHVMVNEALGFSESEMQANPALREQARANLVNQAAAGHTGAISGSQGGTIGCVGVKPETSHEFSRDVFGKASEKTTDATVNPAQLVSRPSAKGNKGAPDKKTLKDLHKLSPEDRLAAVETAIAKSSSKAMAKDATPAEASSPSIEAPSQGASASPQPRTVGQETHPLTPPQPTQRRVASQEPTITASKSEAQAQAITNTPPQPQNEAAPQKPAESPTRPTKNPKVTAYVNAIRQRLAAKANTVASNSSSTPAVPPRGHSADHGGRG